MNGLSLAFVIAAGYVVYAFVAVIWAVVSGWLVPRRSLPSTPAPPPLRPSPEPRADEDPLVTYDDIAQWIPARTRSDIERETGIRSEHVSVHPDGAPPPSYAAR